MLKDKDDSTNIKGSYRSFHIREKKIGANPSKNSYIATEKLEMSRPFAFSLFQNFESSLFYSLSILLLTKARNESNCGY